MNCSFAGIVLAGGKSSRMGRDKADLMLGDKSMLSICQQLLVDAGAKEIVVSRNKGEGVKDVYTGLGPLGGIYSAIVNLSADAVIILPVDMPLLRLQDLSQLFETGHQQGVPVYFKDCFLPLYLPLNVEVEHYLAAQLKSEGNLKVRGLIEHFNGVSITPQSLDVLVNTNTPQQWQKIKQQLSI